MGLMAGPDGPPSGEGLGLPPPDGELVADVPFWRYQWGAGGQGEGLRHLRGLETTETVPGPHAAVYRRTGARPRHQSPPGAHLGRG